MEDIKLAQIIVCKCGATIAACIEPECYVDKDWQKDVRKYTKKGYLIKTINKNDVQFGRCTCKIESSLFPIL